MRAIIYQCDICKREYPYEIKSNEQERGILAKLNYLDIEVCRQCLKKVQDKVKELYV